MLMPVASTQAIKAVIAKESTIAVILKEWVKSISTNQSCWSKWHKNKANKATVHPITLEQSASAGNVGQRESVRPQGNGAII